MSIILIGKFFKHSIITYNKSNVFNPNASGVPVPGANDGSNASISNDK